MTDLFQRFSEDLQAQGPIFKNNRDVHQSCQTTYKTLSKIARRNYRRKKRKYLGHIKELIGKRLSCKSAPYPKNKKKPMTCPDCG